MAANEPGVNLEEATRIAGSDGKFHVKLADAWEIWGPNGGYLAAIALRAAGKVAQIQQPASLYCHFLSSPLFEEVQLDVQLLKKGRRSESLSVRMRQGEKHILQALVRTAADAPGYEHQQLEVPAVSPPHNLKSYDELWAGHGESPRYKFWRNIEARPVAQQTENKSGQAVSRDWARFRPQACFDDLFVDAARSLILLDTYGWPAAWSRYRDNRYIAPNLDTSAWFHQFSPRSEWLLIDHACPVATGGLLGVQGQVWDINGKLLATGGAQLCCLPA